MSPQNPKDPNDLSLQPSKSDGGRKADFSNVQSHSDTVSRGGGGGHAAGGKADFSNVQSHADTQPAQGGSGGGGGGSIYTVRKGDTLSAIAQSQYGKASRWRVIFDANRDQIDNPDLIQPGQVLKLPSLDG